jgi:putative ABC transport system permease protein
MSTATSGKDTYAVWHWMTLDGLRQDLRYALRGLRRNPGFAAVAILTLALGIGMNTAVFSVVNAVLLRPLPYPDAGRLVWLAEDHRRFHMEAVPGPDFLDWKERARSFDRIASYSYGGATLGSGAEAEQVGVAAVSDDFLPMTGARPESGRLFEPGERRALLLTHTLFLRRFGGDPAAVGRTIALDGVSYRIAGVLRPDFRFAVPLDADSREIEALRPSDVSRQTDIRGDRMSILNVIGRLRPGVSLGQAYAELDAVQRNIAREGPGWLYDGVTLRVAPLQERVVGGARAALWVLLGAVGCVLLIACGNVASLLLSRSTARQREIAVRAAIGAGRGRMFAQMAAEGLVLAAAGGASGLLLARFVVAAAVRVGAHAVPRLADADIDVRVLAFTLLISCCAGLVFAAGPALTLSRVDLAHVMKEGGRSLSGGRAALGLRRVLVAGEIALAVVLLAGAGLLLRSFWRMNARPEGFAPERIATMKITLSGASRADDVLLRLAGLPGVESAGISNARMRGIVEAEGIRFPPNMAPQAGFHTVSAGYFQVMGMRLAAGRWLTDRETEPVVMVNQSFARRVFGSADPVGRRIRTASSGGQVTQTGSAGTRNVMATIVGVVADLRYTRLDQEPGPEIYLPYRQATSLRGMEAVLRAAADPTATAAAARKALAALDPGQPVYDVQTLEQALADSIAPRRFNLLLFGTFAASALLLAVIGIYGVMSYAVVQRTHEVGVRMAMGADRGQVVRMIVRQGLATAAAGLAAGVPAALGLTRLIRGMLYEVGPADPWTFAGVCGILLAAVGAACWLPARRASSVDPTIALRYE